MIDRMSVTATAALLAALAAAVPLHASLAGQQTEEEAPDRPVRPEVHTLRIAGPNADAGWLGVRIEDLDGRAADELGLDAPRGARVVGVDEDGPAAGAGLQEDDVVVRFDGERIRSAAELTRLVRETPPGREVGLRVLRDGDARDLSLEVGERPARHLRVRAAGDWPEKLERNLEESLEKVEEGLSEERLERMRERMDRARERWEHRMERAGDSLEALAPRIRMMRRHSAGPPRLGVRMQPVTDQLAEHFGVGDRGGVLVASVREGSAAAGAGLEAGDVIVRFGDEEVEAPGDLAHAVHLAEAGPVSITLVRDGDERTLTLELPERKQPGRHPDHGEGTEPSDDLGVAPSASPGSPRGPAPAPAGPVVPATPAVPAASAVPAAQAPDAT